MNKQYLILKIITNISDLNSQLVTLRIEKNKIDSRIKELEMARDLLKKSKQYIQSEKDD